MPNPFELLEKNVTAVTLATFGFTASWEVSDGSGSFSASVHFGNPSHLVKLSGGRFKADYSPDKTYMEYYLDSFPNLKKRVDSGLAETIEVEGKGRFYVMKVDKESDGDTFIALLQPISET